MLKEALTWRPLDKHAVQTMLQRVEDDLRPELGSDFRCNAHKWRHTFATHWVWNHVKRGQAFDPEELRRILGHSDYSLFKVYANLAKDMTRKDWEVYCPY